jgi:hypothetical protein
LNTKILSISRNTILLGIGVFITLAIVLAASSASISAQDTADSAEIVGYRIVGEGQAGPYTVHLQVSPVTPIVGTSRFAVRVRDTATGEDVDDAFVRVFGTPSEKGERQYSPALNSPVDPVYYLSQLDLEHPGLWAIDVEVESPLGTGTIVMSIQIVERGRTGNGWATALFVLVLLSFVFGISWVWYSSKQALKRRDQQG